jgi:hypothetical protein
MWESLPARRKEQVGQEPEGQKDTLTPRKQFSGPAAAALIRSRTVKKVFSPKGFPQALRNHSSIANGHSAIQSDSREAKRIVWRKR